MRRLDHGPRLVGALARWWFALCAVALVFGSDYKFRRRDPTEALAASVDGAIVVELVLYGLVAAFLVWAHEGDVPRLRRTTPATYFGVLFVGLMALSLTYTPYTEYAIVRVAQMGILLALVLTAAAHATRDHLHCFAHAFVVLVMASVVYGVAVPSEPVSAIHAGRFTWLALHPTMAGVLAGLGTLVAICYLLAGHRARPGPRWPRPVYVTALLVCGGALVATQARGASLGTAAAILVLVVMSRRGRARVEAGLVCIVLLTIPVLASSGLIADYFARGASAENLATLNSRVMLWETALQAVTDNPLFGYGVTSAQGIFYDETGLGGGHNAFVNVLVELGVVGVLVWGAFVISLVAGIRKLPQIAPDQLGLDRAFLLAVITFLLVDGIFFQGPSATTNVAATWLFVCLAWLRVAQREAPVPDPSRGAVPRVSARPAGSLSMQ